MIGCEIWTSVDDFYGGDIEDGRYETYDAALDMLREVVGAEVVEKILREGRGEDDLGSHAVICHVVEKVEYLTP